MNKININKFQKEYEIILSAISKILEDEGIIYKNMTFGFMKLREDGQVVNKIYAEGYCEKAHSPSCCWLSIDEVLERISQ